MNQSKITERLHYPNEIEIPRQILTPSISIALVICVLAVLWARLGGVTMETTVNIAITIPAWIMFLGGLGLMLAGMFGLRIIRDWY